MGEPSEFGKRLAQFRRRKKWSQVELAQRSGVNRVSIARLESGLRQAVDLPAIIALADTLGVAIDQLVRDPLAKKGCE